MAEALGQAVTHAASFALALVIFVPVLGVLALAGWCADEHFGDDGGES